MHRFPELPGIVDVNGRELGLKLRRALQILQERADARVIGSALQSGAPTTGLAPVFPGPAWRNRWRPRRGSASRTTVGETCANPLDKGYRRLGDGRGVIAGGKALHERWQRRPGVSFQIGMDRPRKARIA